MHPQYKKAKPDRQCMGRIKGEKINQDRSCGQSAGCAASSQSSHYQHGPAYPGGGQYLIEEELGQSERGGGLQPQSYAEALQNVIRNAGCKKIRAALVGERKQEPSRLCSREYFGKPAFSPHISDDEYDGREQN